MRATVPANGPTSNPGTREQTLTEKGRPGWDDKTETGVYPDDVPQNLPGRNGRPSGSGPGVASAVPYAYGSITFTNLVLSGLGGVTVNSSTVSTSTSASYAAFSPDAASASGDLTTGSDVRQSFSGPVANAPPPNTFTPALSASSGSRGDALLSGNIATATASASAADVAEGRLLVASSTAASSGGTTTGINLSVTLGATTTFGLSFTASDSLTATTTAAGDGASTQVNASFTVTGAGFGGFIFSPDALNASVSASGVGGSQSFASGPTNYSTSVTVSPGTYQISLLSGAQERLNSGAATVVPEPASLVLLGAGLLGFGLLRRRA